MSRVLIRKRPEEPFKPCKRFKSCCVSTPNRKRQRENSCGIPVQRHVKPKQSRFYTQEEVDKIIGDHRSVIKALVQQNQKLTQLNQELKQENENMRSYIQRHIEPPTRYCTYIN